MRLSTGFSHTHVDGVSGVLEDGDRNEVLRFDTGAWPEETVKKFVRELNMMLFAEDEDVFPWGGEYVGVIPGTAEGA